MTTSQCVVRTLSETHPLTPRIALIPLLDKCPAQVWSTESLREKENQIKRDKQGSSRDRHRDAHYKAKNTSVGTDADLTRQHVSAALRRR